MKVPQTFTIDLDDATYLASLPKGRRSEWIRTAIKMQRLGRRELYDELQEYIEAYDLVMDWVCSDVKRWEAWDDYRNSKESSQERGQIPGNQVSESSDE